MKNASLNTIYLVIIFAVHSTLLGSQDRSYQEWYLTTPDSLELYVKEFKEGSPSDIVVVVHGGFGANHDYMLDAFAGMESDYHLIFYDQRGSLLSPAPVERLYFDRGVEDLRKLIDELGQTSVNIVCHSMGSFVGMEFLERYPMRVKSLVLVSAIPPKASRYEDVFSAKVDSIAAALAQRPVYLKEIRPYESMTGLGDKARTEFWRIQFANYNIYDLSRWRKVKGGKAFYKKEATALGKTADWQFDYRYNLNANGKVTFIQGDKYFLNYNAEPIHSQINGYDNIKLKIIPDAGHLIWIDQPDSFRKSLVDALK